MKPGQTLRRWWQEMVLGRLTTPQAVVASALSDVAPGDLPFFNDLPPKGFDLERLQWHGPWPSPPLVAQWERANWAGVEPRLVRWAAEFQDELRKARVPVYVHCALRSPKEQAALKAAGRSKTLRSYHLHGLAVDIVHSRYHWEMSHEEWRWLALVGRKVLDRINRRLPKDKRFNLVWGGDWSFYDPAHWNMDVPLPPPRPWVDLPPVRLTPRGVLNSPFFLI